MAELTILTASSCLMGEEIRKRLDKDGTRERASRRSRTSGGWGQAPACNPPTLANGLQTL